MKNVIVCLIILLTCSCRKTPWNKMTRHDEVLNIMRQDDIKSLEKADWLTDEEKAELRRLKKNYFAEAKDRDFNPTLVIPGPGWEIRGPLTLAGFKAELIKSFEESSELRKKVYGITEKFEESRLGRMFRRFENLSQEGDELYYFKSDERSWLYLCGKEGYIRIRKNKIADKVITAIN